MAKPLKAPRFTIKALRIASVSFYINAKFKLKKNEEIAFNTNISIRPDYDANHKKLLVKLKAACTIGNIPFFFNIESEGVFILEGKPSKAHIKTIGAINGPAIMFPYVREAVADLSRRAGYAPLHLNPVNFVEMAKHSRPKAASAKGN